MGARRAAEMAVVVGVAAVGGLFGLGGCLQILGDDGTFVGYGGGGTGGTGATGGTSSGGTTSGGTGGTGGTGGAPECTPNETEPCYSGPPGTEGVGICKGGTRTCGGDGKWGMTCEGEQTPGTENPAVVGDEACDGYASQEVVWSAVFGGDLAQSALDVATDPTTGDVLVSGVYDPSGSIDILGTILEPPPQAGMAKPGFLARFGPDGALKSATGPLPRVLNVLVAPTGDVLVTGVADGTIPMAGETLTGTFIGKLNGAGTFDWVRSCAPALQNGVRTAFAKDGNVLVFGTFDGTIDWLDGISFATLGKRDNLLSKLDISDGHVLWAKQLGDVNDDTAVGLAVDPAGNILVAVEFDGNHTQVGTAYAPSDANARSSAIGKLSPSGDADWVVVLKGAGDQKLHAIAVDPVTGDVVVAGQGGTSLVADDTTGVDSTLPGAGVYDLFILGTNAGGEFQWGRALGATYGAFTGLGVGQNGDVFGAGYYMGTADLGGGSLPMTAAYHGFVGRLASNGDHVWSKEFGSVPMGDVVSLVLDSTKLTVLTTADGSVDFGDGSHTTVGLDVGVAVMGR